MALASTSKIQLAYLEESVFGVTPSSPTGAKFLRNTDSSLNYSITKATSSEINATRQSSDAVHVSGAADGSLNFESIYREYDPLYAALLASDFSTDFGTDGVSTLACDFDTATNTITVSAASFAGISAGDWIGVQNSTANDGSYLVESLTTTVLTLSSATPLVADATGDSCDISTSVISNGTNALSTFQFQKHFSDVGQYFLFRGMGVSAMELSFSTGSIMTGSFSFVGKDSVRGTTNSLGTIGASTSFGVMNGVTGVGRVLVDGAALSGTFIKSASVSVEAGLRGQEAVGYLGSVGLGDGTFSIGGKLSIYLNDGSIYDSALADTFVSLQIPVNDVAGNGYVFVFDHVKLGVPPVPAGGKDNDAMLDLDFTAHAPDMTTDKMIKIYRVGQAL